MSEQITPADLARELGVTPKTVRDYLRSTYGTLPAFVSRWHLTAAQATKVREHFHS